MYSRTCGAGASSSGASASSSGASASATSAADSIGDDGDEDLARAIALSLGAPDAGASSSGAGASTSAADSIGDDGDEDIARAIALSLGTPDPLAEQQQDRDLALALARSAGDAVADSQVAGDEMALTERCDGCGMWVSLAGLFDHQSKCRGVIEEHQAQHGVCEVCRNGDRPSTLLLCDGNGEEDPCSNLFHLKCLTPKLKKKPKGLWRCPECVAVRNKRLNDYGTQKGMADSLGTSVVEFRAITAYEEFHGLPRGAASMSDVSTSAAGFLGWYAYYISEHMTGAEADKARRRLEEISRRHKADCETRAAARNRAVTEAEKVREAFEAAKKAAAESRARVRAERAAAAQATAAVLPPPAGSTRRQARAREADHAAAAAPVPGVAAAPAAAAAPPAPVPAAHVASSERMPPATAEAAVTAPSALAHSGALVGRRVRVWWEADDAWFHGKVDNFSSRRGYRIVYDPVEGQDDPSGWVQLDEETWELEEAGDDMAAPPPLVSASSTAARSGDGKTSAKALGKWKRAPEPSAAAMETSSAAQEEETVVKLEALDEDAESRASGPDDPSDVGEMSGSEAEAMRQAQAQEQAALLRRHQEAAALQERRQRSTRIQIFDKKPIRTPDTFACPRCNCELHNYYPNDARACNKLACEKCHTKFCIVCNKPASASCRCISAAWAR